MAKAKIKRSGGTLVGDGLATAGLVLGYGGGVLMLGLMFAMAIPAFQKVRQNAQDISVRNNLIQIWTAAEQQLLESGKDMVSYDELVAGGQILSELKPVAGENYHEIVVRRGDESISVVLGNGRTVTHFAGNAAGDPVVVPADGSDANPVAEPEEEEPETEPAAEPTAPAPTAEPESLAPLPAFG